jgi:hypothetical protein
MAETSEKIGLNAKYGTCDVRPVPVKGYGTVI